MVGTCRSPGRLVTHGVGRAIHSATTSTRSLPRRNATATMNGYGTLADTTPRLGDLWASESTFSVAIHFWLSRLVVLDKPIRQWLTEHFCEAISGSHRLGRAILEIAVVAYRMKAVPLNLLSTSEVLEGGSTLGSRIDDVAIEYPSLGLRRVESPSAASPSFTHCWPSSSWRPSP